ESVDTTIAAERARQANVRNDASGSGPARDGLRKPRVFLESVNVKGKKVKFVAATLEGPDLTWWNSKIATMGLETVNQMP
ncbi:hypothetical protein Tco_1551853, partial [Tanacetum coccineum]